MKKIIASFAAASIMVSSICAFAGDISVSLDGKEIQFDTYPEIVNDRTFVPIRAVAESFGAEVLWDEASKLITIRKGDVVNKLSIGNTTVYTNDVSSVIEAAPYIKDDRTMVPLRYIAEAFNMEVEWNGEERKISISSADNNTSPSEALGSSEKIDNSDIKLKYYPGFELVPDFGAYAGIEKEPQSTEEMYSYISVPEEKKKGYIELLLSLGFVQVDEMLQEGIESYAYEKDNTDVVVMDFGNVYGVTLMEKREAYNGKIEYYSDYPSVPDYGVINNVKAANETKAALNITEYTYERAEGTEAPKQLLNYLDALEICGFSQYLQTMTTVMYVNNESQNTVIIDQSNTDEIVVSVEQWPENKQ